MPFEVAAFLDEHAGTLLLSLIPVLTILVPLIRTVPGIYNWVARRQILYWYRRLHVIERPEREMRAGFAARSDGVGR